MIYDNDGNAICDKYTIVKYTNDLPIVFNIDEGFSDLKAGVQFIIRKMIDWIKDIIDFLERVPVFKDISKIKKNKSSLKSIQNVNTLSKYFSSDGYKDNKWIENFKNACMLIRTSPYIDNIESKLYEGGNKDTWFQGESSSKEIPIDDVINFAVNIKKFIAPLRQAYSEVKIFDSSLSHGEKINKELITVLYKYLSQAISTIKDLSRECIRICLGILNQDSKTENKDLADIDKLKMIAMSNKSTDKEQIEVVKQVPCLIKLMKNPCEQAQLIAIESNPAYFQDINNPTNAVKIKVIHQAPWAINYIDSPSEALQMEAVMKNSGAIYFISDPTNKVKEYVNNYNK